MISITPGQYTELLIKRRELEATKKQECTRCGSSENPFTYRKVMCDVCRLAAVEGRKRWQKKQDKRKVEE